MRISNVGMFVKDLERAKDFFVEYFHATVHCQYQEDNGFKEYILKFDEGPKLEIMTKPEIVDEKKNINRTGFIHICFKVDSIEQLNDLSCWTALRFLSPCPPYASSHFRKCRSSWKLFQSATA